MPALKASFPDKVQSEGKDTASDSYVSGDARGNMALCMHTQLL